MATHTAPRELGDAGTLQRGLAILRLLGEAATPLTAREISEAVKVNDSTTHRLLQALCDHGYVCRGDDKRYHAAPLTLVPLGLYHPLNVLRREVADVLRGLRDELGMTSSLVVFVGMERLVLDISGSIDISPYYDTRLTSPLHASATGKLLLASLSPERRKEALGPPPWKAYTPRTITDPAALESELHLTSERGVATNMDENFIGLSAASAPIYLARTQPIACLTIAGPSERFKAGRLHAICDALTQRARLVMAASPSLRAVSKMFFGHG